MSRLLKCGVDARATEFDMMPHGFMSIYWVKDRTMNEAKDCIAKSIEIMGALMKEVEGKSNEKESGEDDDDLGKVFEKGKWDGKNRPGSNRSHMTIFSVFGITFIYEEKCTQFSLFWAYQYNKFIKYFLFNTSKVIIMKKDFSIKQSNLVT